MIILISEYYKMRLLNTLDTYLDMSHLLVLPRAIGIYVTLLHNDDKLCTLFFHLSFIFFASLLNAYTDPICLPLHPYVLGSKHLYMPLQFIHLCRFWIYVQTCPAMLCPSQSPKWLSAATYQFILCHMPSQNVCRHQQ
jgi:hypothetical protein